MPLTEVPVAEQKEKALIRRMSGEQLPAPLLAGHKLGNIILKACEFHQEKRYQSIEEFQRALSELTLEDMKQPDRLLFEDEKTEILSREMFQEDNDSTVAFVEPADIPNVSLSQANQENTSGMEDEDDRTVAMSMTEIRDWNLEKSVEPQNVKNPSKIKEFNGKRKYVGIAGVVLVVVCLCAAFVLSGMLAEQSSAYNEGAIKEISSDNGEIIEEISSDDENAIEETADIVENQREEENHSFDINDSNNADVMIGHYNSAKGETVILHSSEFEGNLSVVSDAGNVVEISGNEVMVTGKKSGKIVIQAEEKSIGFNVFVGEDNFDKQVNYMDYSVDMIDADVNKEYDNYIDCIRDRMMNNMDVTYMLWGSPQENDTISLTNRGLTIGESLFHICMQYPSGCDYIRWTSDDGKEYKYVQCALYYDKVSDCVFYKQFYGLVEDSLITDVEWGCWKNKSRVIEL